MAHVVVLDSINEDIFVCGVCKLVFNSLPIFLDHKKQHCRNEIPRTIESAINESSSCENVTTSQNSELHQTVSPSNATPPPETWANEVSCNTCGKTFKKMKSLLAHLKTHNDRPYQCPVCGRCFVQNSHLQRHIATHKVWPDGLTETTPKSPEAELLSYSCSYCDLILPNYSQFRLHLKKHLSHKKFKCIQSNCSELLSDIDSLLQHISISHDTTIYQCHICNQTFNTLEDIAAHQQTHIESEKTVHSTDTVRHKCAQCDAIFKNPEKLSLHLLTENHRKVCIHCNKMFASDKRLRLHLQIHRKSKPFQCNVCNSSFHMKKYLSSHMLKHGDKQFACPVCNHKFKRKDLLQRHMKSHQTKKLFKCPFQDTLDCRKEFSRSDKLKSHVKFHTKRLLAQPSPQQPAYENAGTVEICIVPLDGGDVVSDDGSGSISIYGETFKDENLDTQHTMAGFVSMANKGKDTNGCQFIITTTGTPWLDNLHTVVGRVTEGQNVVHMLEHTPTDVEDRPQRRVYIADCGLLPTPQPFYVSDDPYDLWAWIKATAVPLTMSFSILGFFHWMMRKMEI